MGSRPPACPSTESRPEISTEAGISQNCVRTTPTGSAGETTVPLVLFSMLERDPNSGYWLLHPLVPFEWRWPS